MTEPRHIVFLNEFYHPDICASASVLADRLPRLKRLRPDWRFTVIAGNRAWDNPDVVYPEVESVDGVDIVRVSRPRLTRGSLLRRGAGFAAFHRGTIRAAKQLTNVDAVVGTTAPPQGGFLAKSVAGKLRCPYIYTVLDLYPDLADTLGKLSASSLVFKQWLRVDTRTMRNAASVVSISQGITDRIAATRGVPSDRLVTIHDGFDPARLQSEEQDGAFGREFNPDGKFVVQYAGNMGLSHPFESIVEASCLLADHDDILFQFIGDGPQRAVIKRHMKQNARLIDYQPSERLGDMLRSADICLISQNMAMYQKSLPYKVYGIFAGARPAIFVGNAKSEMAVWLSEAKAGVQVDQGDPQALADVILRLKQDPESLAKMGGAGLQYLRDNLHAQRAAEKWIELFDVCLNVSHRASSIQAEQLGK